MLNKKKSSVQLNDVGVGTSFQQLNLTNCEAIDDPRSSTRKCETHRASFQHS